MQPDTRQEDTRQRDTTYDIEWSPLSETPIEAQNPYPFPVDRSAQIPQRRSQEGLLPVSPGGSLIPVEEQPVGPAHAFPRSRKMVTLEDVGKHVLEELKTHEQERERVRRVVTPGRHTLELGRERKVPTTIPKVWDFPVDAALLTLMREKKKLEKAGDVALPFVMKHLVLDTMLVASGGHRTEPFPNPVRTEINHNTVLETTWPGSRLIAIFARIAEITTAGSVSGVLDKEQILCQFLRLYLTDVFDHSEAKYRVVYSDEAVRLWSDLRGANADEEEPRFNAAISIFHAEEPYILEDWARETEKWVWSQVQLSKSRSKNNVPPPGYIAHRIMRVCIQFRSIFIRVWKDDRVSDPRGQLPAWHLTPIKDVLQDHSRRIATISTHAEASTIPASPQFQPEQRTGRIKKVVMRKFGLGKSGPPGPEERIID